MSATQKLLRHMVAQFHNPTGPGGHVAGWVMGHRRSNVVRNRWAVDLLDLQPGQRVLELGCGPGVALAAMAEHIGDGVAVGVDHSPVMIGHARRRNAGAVAAGRVQVICAAVEDVLPLDGDDGLARASFAALDAPFDAVLAVNNVGLWDRPAARLSALRTLIRPGGGIAVVSQPRSPGATRETSEAAGAELSDLLQRAGYTAIAASMLDLDPPVVCLRATR